MSLISQAINFRNVQNLFAHSKKEPLKVVKVVMELADGNKITVENCPESMIDCVHLSSPDKHYYAFYFYNGLIDWEGR